MVGLKLAERKTTFDGQQLMRQKHATKINFSNLGSAWIDEYKN